CDNSQVSGALHLIVELYTSPDDASEHALVQVTEYSGRLGGKRWRFTLSTKGVIGRCLRTQKPEWVNFGSLAEYEERMVTEFGFTPKEVQEHTQQARSYWAEPVVARGQMVGVMYLFSTELQVFPCAAEKSSLEGAAREIAAFLEGARLV
ncbi:MAG: GAF domain-containing protein, partial [Terriglobia bacterium]